MVLHAVPLQSCVSLCIQSLVVDAGACAKRHHVHAAPLKASGNLATKAYASHVRVR
jgi:hypothetical protein